MVFAIGIIVAVVIFAVIAGRSTKRRGTSDDSWSTSGWAGTAATTTDGGHHGGNHGGDGGSTGSDGGADGGADSGGSGGDSGGGGCGGGGCGGGSS